MFRTRDPGEPRSYKGIFCETSAGASAGAQRIQMQKGETGKNLSSENPKQMGAPGFQGEQAMWVLPLYAEGLNTSLSQRKACVSDSMLPHLILRLRGLQGPADAPAEAHPSGQDWDRQECHWQQHPGPEVLPLQAESYASHQNLRQNLEGGPAGTWRW